ncbi:hypothetical protein FOCC_FOCC004694 [Frankliniella occidentalis]|nr:hypothetical protein FOCC_FOCC004694 [Frankliniella occidentalis]
MADIHLPRKMKNMTKCRKEAEKRVVVAAAVAVADAAVAVGAEAASAAAEVAAGAEAAAEAAVAEAAAVGAVAAEAGTQTPENKNFTSSSVSGPRRRPQPETRSSPMTSSVRCAPRLTRTPALSGGRASGPACAAAAAVPAAAVAVAEVAAVPAAASTAVASRAAVSVLRFRAAVATAAVAAVVARGGKHCEWSVASSLLTPTGEEEREGWGRPETERGRKWKQLKQRSDARNLPFLEGTDSSHEFPLGRADTGKKIRKVGECGNAKRSVKAACPKEKYSIKIMLFKVYTNNLQFQSSFATSGPRKNILRESFITVEGLDQKDH